MIDTSLDSSNLYFLVAVLQGITIAAIIILRKPFRKSHLFLGLLIFLFSLSLLHLILEESIHAFNSQFPVPMEFSFMFGPLAYLHTVFLKRPRAGMKFSRYLHFLPSLMIDVVLFTTFFLFVRAHEEWAYANIENIQTVALLIMSLCLLQLAVYTYLIYLQMRPDQSLPKEFSPIRKWLKTLIFTWLVMLGFLTIAIPIALLNIEHLDENSYLIYKPLGIIIGLCIYGLGYLYLLKYINHINEYIDRSNRVRFSLDELQKKRDLLISSLKRDKHYLRDSVTVAKLAEHMRWPINDLSLVINEALSTNFNDLMNKYRIQEFMELVGKPENKKYSILGLAEKVGFGSKASFYRAFKKETGLTPSEYLKS